MIVFIFIFLKTKALALKLTKVILELYLYHFIIRVYIFVELYKHLFISLFAFRIRKNLLFEMGIKNNNKIVLFLEISTFRPQPH